MTQLDLEARRRRMIHPEVAGEAHEGAVAPDGQPLAHAEGTSTPLRSRPREAQPRGANVHGRHRIDQAEAAKRFIEATDHEKMHDERLWDVRQKRDGQRDSLVEWEELRELASQIKQHTLAHLDEYVAEFADAAAANGVHVHFAVDAAEHNRIVHGILADHGVRTLIKSKSMLTDECGFREAMDAAGIEVVETDLGERIQQLDGEGPSNIVVPAVHKTRGDVAEVFARAYGSDPDTDDIPTLASLQRDNTRPLILAAEAGMTGCNFAVAETGGVTVCTNEGNADLSANTPPLHIVSMGIEKLIPRVEDLGVFVRLLSRSALGSPMTQYTSHFRKPRAGAEMHIVIVDNGRSARLGMPEFWSSLKCIRCGACMATCPVYRRSGGLSYGGVYSGPIGAILNPNFDRHKFSALPFASTLNGSCTNVCPVKINIHEQIFGWRKVLSEAHELPVYKSGMMKAAGVLLSHPGLYRAAVGMADSALRHLPHFIVYNPLNSWTAKRDMPEAPPHTFHSWWAHNRQGKTS
jgi:L-lactate dehydrogenase complex protein LldF